MLKSKRDIINNNYSLEEVVNLYGKNFPVKKIGRNYRSDSFINPSSGHSKNKDNKVDYNFKQNVWCDLSAGNTGGGIVEYVQHMMNFNDSEEAINFLAKEKGLELKETIDLTPQTSFQKHIIQCNNNLNSNRFKAIKDFLIQEKGYTESYINDNYIGFADYNVTGRIIYPIFDEYGLPVYYEARSISAELNKKVYPNNTEYREPPAKFIGVNEDRFKDSELKKETPYNFYNRTFKSGNTIYITEGVADSDALFQLNMNNVCTSGTKRTTDQVWKTKYNPVFNNHKTVVYFGDNDDDGRKAVVDNIIDHIYKYGVTNVFVQIVPKTKGILDSDTPYKDHFLSNDDTREKYGSEWTKDINDIYSISRNAVFDTIKTRINAVEYIAMYYKDLEKREPEESFKANFTKAIEVAYRYINPYKLNDIFNKLEAKEIITADENKELQKFIKKPPLDRAIVEEVINKSKINPDDNRKTLLYDKKLNFYQFNGKIWEQREEQHLKTEINDFLGYRFSNGAKINSVYNTLTSSKEIVAKNSEEMTFNKKDVLVFQNGTLYLNDGEPEFKKDIFKPEDKTTFICNFEYNPEAECPNWKKVLREGVETYDSNGELNKRETDLKYKMLQEYAGYILSKDCSFEKALVLFGDGENGKSVYFETIRKLFDEKATTKLKMQQFKDNFTLIHLKDAILNISGETKESLRGAEEDIKSIVSGEPIMDSLKNRDLVTFTPRAKLIISANNPFKVADQSNGTARRFNFIVFGNKFTSDLSIINNKTVKLAHINLKRELEEEKQGIMNWILEGYKIIKDKQKKNLPLTESNESKSFYEQFKISNNPTREYVITQLSSGFNFDDLYPFKENEFNELGLDRIHQNMEYNSEENEISFRVSANTLFDDYKEFCSENGYQAGGKNGFSNKIKMQCKDLGIGLERDQGTTRADRLIYYIFTYNERVLDNIDSIKAQI